MRTERPADLVGAEGLRGLGYDKRGGWERGEDEEESEEVSTSW